MKTSLREVAHEIASDIYEAGGIDAVTMRQYDALCLSPVRELSAKEIKHIRLHEKVSQSVFARFLNISASIVKQWEQGAKHPKGASLKLLNIVAEKGLEALA